MSQGTRSEALSSFSGEYFEFLKSCDIRLNINIASSKNIDRIHELIQRTNQLNFSGNRYTRNQIIEIIESQKYDHYCMDATDKFVTMASSAFV